MSEIETKKSLVEITAMFTLAVLGIFALLAAALMFDAFVLKTLWLWFVVPTFGLAPLSIPATIGLAILFHLAIRYYPPSTNSDESKAMVLGRLAAYIILTPSLALLIGWIAQMFM